MSDLAPGFLVAAPPLGDPNFDRSVVLLAAHGAEGAFGWIINGREVMTLAELVVRAGVASTEPPIRGGLRIGGPVAPEQVWLVYRARDRFPDIEEQLEIGPGVIACASRRVLESLAAGHQIDGVFGVRGYAGWAPQQLEAEIRQGAWLPTDLDPELVFARPEELWQKAYAGVGATPMAFSSRVGLA
ncbi:MAG: YqgE/AlgH family protein [Pseudomonadota bacterium]